MKRKLSLLALVSGLCLSAQDVKPTENKNPETSDSELTEKQEFRHKSDDVSTNYVAIKGGYNMSITKDDTNGHFFYTGLALEFPLNKKNAVQVELLYTNVNPSSTVFISVPNPYYHPYFNPMTMDFVRVKASTSIHALYIPVGIKHYTNERFALLAGFKLGFLVSSTLYTEPIVGNDSRLKLEKDIDKLVNSFQFGAFVGLEYQFDKHLFIDTRIYKTFTDVMNKVEGSYATFQLGMGYRF